MPMTATSMPSTRPIAVAATEMIRVLVRPTVSICGRTSAMAEKSKKVRPRSFSQSMEAPFGVRPGSVGGRDAGVVAAGQVLLRHRGAGEPLLVQLLPGAVLHRGDQRLVQRAFQGSVALLQREPGRGVEGGDVGG